MNPYDSGLEVLDITKGDLLLGYRKSALELANTRLEGVQLPQDQVRGRLPDKAHERLRHREGPPLSNDFVVRCNLHPLASSRSLAKSSTLARRGPARRKSSSRASCSGGPSAST